MIRYLSALPLSKTILWCYLIWYLVTLAWYFDPAWRLWFNSLGISVIIGFALLLSVGIKGWQDNKWPTLRLFMMPFCVSSFSSMIKGQGYILIFPTELPVLVSSIAAVSVFVIVRLLMLRFLSSSQ